MSIVSELEKSNISTNTINEYELKTYILKNSKFRDQAWIVLNQLDTIVKETKSIYRNGTDELHDYDLSQILNDNTIQYIYIADMNIKPLNKDENNSTSNSIPKEQATLFSILEDNQNKYYLIRHIGIREVKPKNHISKEPEQFEINSRIDIFDTLQSLIDSLSATDKKKYNLKLKKNKDKKDKNKHKDINTITGLNFINNWQNKELLIKFIGDKEFLDLSGLFLLNSNIFRDIEQTFNTVKTICIYQNARFVSFDYLKNFPNLETLSYWCVNLQDEDLIALANTRIQKLEFHQCNLLTGRCLPILAKMKLLTMLLFDNQYMLFQKNTFNTVLHEDEIKDINNESLETLILNAHNYTMDFALLVFQMFTRLNKMVIPQDVYETFIKNGYSGHEKDELVIQNYDQPQFTITFRKQVRFRNLLKSRYNNQPFSDAMMKAINRRGPLQTMTTNTTNN